MLLILIVSALALLADNEPTPSSLPAVDEASQNKLIENIEYQTILPEGKQIGNLGGWKQVKADNNSTVYSYADTLAGVNISVSQQPLSAELMSDSARRVAEIAKSFGSTTELSAGDTQFYLGTSSKGPQSVIFTKNNLLIMIKSDSEIPESDWISYIESLN